ncbi:acyl-CoA dehydrogenase family protein [Micromonospora sediminicola]|uniref:acyl-CoA dehydrogenase family protein n=1 Tax=Micromonospora sediminicola TaxID=946078 RepID=UPI00341055CF
MDLPWTGTHDDLTAAARKHLEDHYPLQRITELSGYDAVDTHAWRRLITQGWLDPELTPTELAILAEQSGRALHPGPWLSTAAFGMPLLATAGMAVQEPTALAHHTDSLTAEHRAAQWLLSGIATDVIDAHLASVIAVVADTHDGPAVFTIRADDPTAQVTTSADVDLFRPHNRLRLHDTPATLALDARHSAAALTHTRRHAAALIASEAVGVADRALDLAVSYAGIRHQFNRPIATFQAVAHQLAASYADIELARSLARHTAHVLSTDPTGDNIDDDIACALYASTRAAVSVCETAIQIHGGIGVTYDFPLHHWYRRALWTERFADQHNPLDHLADTLLGPA